MRNRVRTLLILGDLTDAKDYHSAQLVNMVVQAIVSVSEVVEEVLILQGNHDYLKEGHAFFGFLSVLPKVRFITKPTDSSEHEGSATTTAYFLPHTKTPSVDWKDMSFDFYSFLFMHQTVTGSIASNGQKMQGEPLPPLNAGKVYSGDIHVPQVIGDVEYVGSPYHVHFGDRFNPRCILLDRKGVPHDLRFKSIQRVTVDVHKADASDLKDLDEGDQVKVRVHLTSSEKADWRQVRRTVSEKLRQMRVEVHGVELVVPKSRRLIIGAARGSSKLSRLSPEDALTRFVLAEELGADMLDVGLEILE